MWLTFHDDGFVVVDGCSRKSHLMEFRLAFHIELILLATENLLAVSVESIKIRYLNGLVHIGRSLLGCVQGGQLDVSVWWLGSPIQGQRGIEGIEPWVIAVVAAHYCRLLEMEGTRCRVGEDQRLDLERRCIDAVLGNAWKADINPELYSALVWQRGSLASPDCLTKEAQ